jgi:hypothetical protein
MQKRITVYGLKALAGIAAVAFFFMPESSLTKFLLCFGCLAAAAICYVAATKLERKEGSGLDESDKAQTTRSHS